MMFGIGKKRIMRRRVMRRRRTTSVTPHYIAHKEAARALVLARLNHFNTHYQYTWNRIAIRNTKRSWGSCSGKRNLNFSYKLLFLPPALCDYVIAHELCHLKEMNHGSSFWKLLNETVSDYEIRRKALRNYEGKGEAILLKAMRSQYHAHTTVPIRPNSCEVTNSLP